MLHLLTPFSEQIHLRNVVYYDVLPVRHKGEKTRDSVISVEILFLLIMEQLNSNSHSFHIIFIRYVQLSS